MAGYLLQVVPRCPMWQYLQRMHPETRIHCNLSKERQRSSAAWGYFRYSNNSPSA